MFLFNLRSLRFSQASDVYHVMFMYCSTPNHRRTRSEWMDVPDKARGEIVVRLSCLVGWLVG